MPTLYDNAIERVTIEPAPEGKIEIRIGTSQSITITLQTAESLIKGLGTAISLRRAQMNSIDRY